MSKKTRGWRRDTARQRRAWSLLTLLVVVFATALAPLTAQAQFRDPVEVTAQEVRVATPVEIDPATIELASLNDDFWTNGGATACIAPIGVAHAVATALSFIKDPFGIGAYAGLVAFGLNIAVKQCAPVVVPGDAVLKRPTVDSTKPCAVDLNLIKTAGRYSNIMGVPMPGAVEPFLVPGSSQVFFRFYPQVGPGAGWGDIESPFVYHYNSKVDVTLRSPQGATRTAWPVVPAGMTEYPVGVYPYVWRGQSLITDWDKNPINALISWYPVGQLSRSRDGLGVILVWVALKVGNLTLASKLFEAYPSGAYNDEAQYVYIYDMNAPTFAGVPPLVTVEAGIPGGASPDANLSILRQGFTVSDDCDPNPSVMPLTTRFWPLGEESLIRWRAEDNGPAENGPVNVAFAEQRVRVQDTNPPIIAPPMPVVTETVSGELVLPLRPPPVFDFADLQPTITHNQQANIEGDAVRFPKGKTTVVWTARDGSGNVSTAQQLINVKGLGENRAPTANGQTAPQATSFEPLTLTLSASDPDGDPLWFTIEEQPGDGFFIAPLFPYFIEDYRVESSATVEDLNALCAAWPIEGDDWIDLEFPYQAEYVAVDDAGRTFVVDRGIYGPCPGGGQTPGPNRRIAIFDDQGQLLGSDDLNNDLNDIHINQAAGRIYTTLRSTPGGPGYINEYDLNLNFIRTFRTDYANVPLPQTPAIQVIREPVSAVLDAARDILYVADRTRIHAYKPEYHGGNCCGPTYLGTVHWYSQQESITDLAIDSEGNLYVSLREADRIAKYAPTTFDAGGNAQIGQEIGWLGKCNTDLGDGTQVHCDVANNRSIGYSCTDATCGHATAPNADPEICLPGYIGGKCTPGVNPGQFQDPRGIAIDPNDNLYVTDYGNKRVQRFTPEGFFAGQAISKCGGACFVLGDFNAPRDITVNSTRFYILDNETDLLHVSETTPIVEKTDTTATVVYASDNNFVGTDSFKFSATDGLAKSNIATVNVPVQRNFRPPFARAGLSFTLPEDTPTPITLVGSDPDLPLDTLTYQISTPPLNGTITGNGPTRTYTPNPDYYGPDSFEFTVSDGRFTSAPELVTLTITPVPDPPVVTVPGSLTAGLGYPVQLSATFEDPDMDDSHSLRIDWGDGTIQTAGAGQIDLVALASEGGPIISDARNGRGSIYAEHIYTSAPTGPVQVCVKDGAGTETCRNLSASAQPMAEVSVLVDHVQNPAIVGRTITYELIVAHKAPTVGGVTATNVVVTDRFDPGMSFVNATASQGSCAFAAPLLTCNVGSLAPDSLATIVVEAQPQSSLVAGSRWQHRIHLQLDQPTPRDNEDTQETITLIAPADIVVNSLLDGPDANPGDGVCATASGVCSLRAAVEEANADSGARTIGLGPEVYRTDLSEEALVAMVMFSAATQGYGPLVITDDVTIRGLGIYSTVVSAGQSERTLIVEGGATVNLVDLQITGGETDGNGGGLLVRNGNVTLDGVLVSDNRAQEGGGIALEQGSLTVLRSMIVNNVASGAGGGLLIAGGAAELTNSTLGGNQAETEGGAIANRGALKLTHTTVAGNEAATGGGVHNSANGTLANSLLAGNRATTGPNCSGSFTLQQANLVQNAGGCSVGGAITGQNPRLYPLDDYGGETLIFAIGSNSPARDAATCIIATDQRGAPRPVGERCDLGAAEYGAAGDPSPVYETVRLPIVVRR